MSQIEALPPVYIRVITAPWALFNRLITKIAGKFGAKSKEVERFLKFAFVGVIGAIVDFGTLLVMQATILKPVAPHQGTKVILATTIAFIVAVSSNFIWNRYWTYPDSRTRSIRRQLAQFFSINAVGWVMRTIWIRFTYLPIGVAVTPLFLELMSRISPEYVQSADTTEKLGTITAQLCAIGIVMVWNFFANRYWTYNDIE